VSQSQSYFQFLFSRNRQDRNWYFHLDQQTKTKSSGQVNQADAAFIQFQLEFVLVPCGKWFLNYVSQYKEIYNTNLTIHQCHWIGEMKLEAQPSAQSLEN
jgi:hypothetical protein